MHNQDRPPVHLKAICLVLTLLFLTACSSFIPDVEVGDPLEIDDTTVTLVSASVMEETQVTGSQAISGTAEYRLQQGVPPLLPPVMPPSHHGHVDPEEIDALIGQVNEQIQSELEEDILLDSDLTDRQRRVLLEQMQRQRQQQREQERNREEARRKLNSANQQLIEQLRRQQEQRSQQQNRAEEERQLAKEKAEQMRLLAERRRAALEKATEPDTTPDWFAPPVRTVELSGDLIPDNRAWLINQVDRFRQSAGLIEFRWLGADPPEHVELHGFALGVMVLEEGSDEIIANPSASAAFTDPVVLQRYEESNSYVSTGPLPDIDLDVDGAEAVAVVRALNDGATLQVVFDVSLLIAPGIPADAGVAVTFGADGATLSF